MENLCADLGHVELITCCGYQMTEAQGFISRQLVMALSLAVRIIPSILNSRDVQWHPT